MISQIQKDATLTEPNKRTIIAHVVNDIGAFGAGFSGALELAYPGTRAFYQTRVGKLHQGQNILHSPNRNVIICHMIAQSGIRGRNNPVPLRYGSLHEGLYQLVHAVNRFNSEGHKIDIIQMPCIGSGLAGGDWDRILGIINETTIELDHNVEVVVCHLPSEPLQCP